MLCVLYMVADQSSSDVDTLVIKQLEKANDMTKCSGMKFRIIEKKYTDH